MEATEDSPPPHTTPLTLTTSKPVRVNQQTLAKGKLDTFTSLCTRTVSSRTHGGEY